MYYFFNTNIRPVFQVEPELCFYSDLRQQRKHFSHYSRIPPVGGNRDIQGGKLRQCYLPASEVHFLHSGAGWYASCMLFIGLYWYLGDGYYFLASTIFLASTP